jgi:2-phospho-L-lactate guanylyltransferase
MAGLHVLVPLKRLEGAKTRLRGLLAPAERAALVEAMLADVLAAVTGNGPVTLVSSDPLAPALAGRYGVAWWDDRGLAWNDALAAALAEIVREPVAAVVSADCPLLERDDLAALAAAVPPRGIAIARAIDAGTNAVAMRPPGVVGTCFGVSGSAAVHAELARAAAVDAVIVDRTGTALDLDTPADVERFLAERRPTHTLEFLERTLAGRAA